MSETFTCNRLSGRPRLSTSDCGARWTRAQRPGREDVGRPASFDICRGCDVGAANAGSPQAAPVPVPTPPHVVARRIALVAYLRTHGEATLADLHQLAVTLSGGMLSATSTGTVHHDLECLIAEHRLVKLRPGLYALEAKPLPPPRVEVRRHVLAQLIRQRGAAGARLHETMRALVAAGYPEATSALVAKDAGTLVRAGQLVRGGRGVYYAQAA